MGCFKNTAALLLTGTFGLLNGANADGLEKTYGLFQDPDEVLAVASKAKLIRKAEEDGASQSDEPSSSSSSSNEDTAARDPDAHTKPDPAGVNENDLQNLMGTCIGAVIRLQHQLAENSDFIDDFEAAAMKHFGVSEKSPEVVDVAWKIYMSSLLTSCFHKTPVDQIPALKAWSSTGTSNPAIELVLATSFHVDEGDALLLSQNQQDRLRKYLQSITDTLKEQAQQMEEQKKLTEEIKESGAIHATKTWAHKSARVGAMLAVISAVGIAFYKMFTILLSFQKEAKATAAAAPPSKEGTTKPQPRKSVKKTK